MTSSRTHSNAAIWSWCYGDGIRHGFDLWIIVDSHSNSESRYTNSPLSVFLCTTHINTYDCWILLVCVKEIIKKPSFTPGFLSSCSMEFKDLNSNYDLQKNKRFPLSINHIMDHYCLRVSMSEVYIAFNYVGLWLYSNSRPRLLIYQNLQPDYEYTQFIFEFLHMVYLSSCTHGSAWTHSGNPWLWFTYCTCPLTSECIFFFNINFADFNFLCQ